MTRIRVKICGITRIEDALAAATHGADAIGLVFHPASRRYVDHATAAAIVAFLPPFVGTVGLFLDAPPERVRETLARVPLDLLQFHGSESPDYCTSFERPYLKAVAMGDGADLAAEARRHAGARGLLLDSHRAGGSGGSGQVFDWERVPRDCARPLVLAGGLHPGNIAEAVRQVRPWGVDVSSGVETAPGIKDNALIGAFMQHLTGY
ncbi:MAG: phosphoribosylanthranilate isomerase [Candidatus Competibacterales bacterium]|nr:phosphoribosylanthranilate isomerase [Candidatus Competibacterales bacterium]